MSLGPPPIQPPSPEEQNLADIEAQLAGLQGQEVQPMGPPGFLESLFNAGVGDPGFTPMGFGQGLLSGLGQGLASRGQKTAQKRQQVESMIQQQRQQGIQQKLEDLKARRQAAFQELAATRSEGRKAAAEQKKEAEKQITIDDSMVAKNPKLAPYKGMQVDRQSLINAAIRPETPYVIMGADGNPIIVPTSNAFGQRPAANPKTATGAQTKALGFYQIGQGALDNINAPDASGQTLEQRIKNQGPIGQLQGQRAPNFLQTQDQQLYRQAQRAFTEARLRQVSGSQINASEYEHDAKTYFYQPGDTDAVTAQKAISRQTVLDGIRNDAGPAYEDYYGEAPPKPSLGNTNTKQPRATESAVNTFKSAPADSAYLKSLGLIKR